MINVKLKVSTVHESTSFPWWVILDPRQNMRRCYDSLGSQVTGPYFSRKEAEDFLHMTRYNFSPRAVVYCMSGTYARQYKMAYDWGKATWWMKLKWLLSR